MRHSIDFDWIGVRGKLLCYTIDIVLMTIMSDMIFQVATRTIIIIVCVKCALVAHGEHLLMFYDCHCRSSTWNHFLIPSVKLRIRQIRTHVRHSIQQHVVHTMRTISLILRSHIFCVCVCAMHNSLNVNACVLCVERINERVITLRLENDTQGNHKLRKTYVEFEFSWNINAHAYAGAFIIIYFSFGRIGKFKINFSWLSDRLAAVACQDFSNNLNSI